MQFLRNLPIKRKLLFVTLAACCAALALACAILLSFQTVQFRGAFSAELETLAEIIAQNSSAPLAFDDRKSAVEVLSSLRVKPNIIHASVFDQEGREFAHFGDDSVHHGKRVQGDGVIFNRGVANITVPIAVVDGQPGSLTIWAGYRARQQELLGLYAGVLATVVASSLVVILLLSPFMHRIVSTPIVRLAQVAQAITDSEDYSARAPAGGKDEVGRLTRAFNRMLDQIEARDAALRESQERYELAVAGSRDGIWDWDIKKGVAHFSPRWKEMIGYADPDLGSSHDEWLQRLHPQDKPAAIRSLEDCLAGKAAAYEAEFRLAHKDGGYRWFLARGAALRDSDGKPVRLSGSQTDITDRKEAQLALQASEERFRSLAQSAPDAIVSANAAGQIVSWNPAAERLFGSAERERIGTAFDAILSEPSRQEYRLLLEQLAAAAGDSRAGHTAELTGLNAKGAFPIELSIAPWGVGGARHFTSVIRDISERKSAEAELARLNRELMKASREAGMAEIATGVLHNVGNVLNSVNVSASLIVDALRRSKMPMPAKISELIQANRGDLDFFLTRHPKGRQLPEFFDLLGKQMIEEQGSLITEAQRLQEGVQHIKQIVAMQNSCAKTSGVLELIALESIAEDALNLSSSSLARHKVEVVRDFQPIPKLLTDRHKVLQILINLIANAKHALESRPADRKLTLSISSAPGGSARIEVTDNGSGILAENLTRIFRHGFTTKPGGHGFGLHHGANSAKELGGSLMARSAGLGQGATFALELPVQKASPAGQNFPPTHSRNA